jgi:hypothetical protein
VHTFQVRIFDPLDIDQFVFTPESDFRNVFVQRVDTQVDLISRSCVVDFKWEVVNRDFSVSVNSSFHSEAEDIFDRLERGSDFEFSEERLFLFESSLKSKIRDLLSGGVNLVVVIP